MLYSPHLQHWLLSKRNIPFVVVCLHFNRITLAAALRIDCRETRIEAGRPVGGGRTAGGGGQAWTKGIKEVRFWMC